MSPPEEGRLFGKTSNFRYCTTTGDSVEGVAQFHSVAQKPSLSLSDFPVTLRRSYRRKVKFTTS